jgi:hypothetical protein
MVAGGTSGENVEVVAMNAGPITQRELEILARISVLEYLVAQLFNQQYLAQGATLEWVKEQHQKFKNLLMRQTNPGFDAAQSDLITGEIENAADDILLMIEQLFERYSRAGKTPPALPETTN